jgi:tetratricopeptide (TPR) repeat protein
VAYEAAGQPDRAEAAYQRALAVDAEYADVRRRLAMLMLRRGATDEARRQVEAALLVQPNRAALRTLLEP